MSDMISDQIAGLNHRLARLEGLVEGIRTSLTITLSALGIISTILLALTSYSLVRIDALSTRIDALPAKISADLRDITSTLSQAITAAKQPPPQVIVIPAPDWAPRPDAPGRP